MPYIYAIEEEITGKDENGKDVTTFAYHPVSQETAETHKQGRWKLVSVYGRNATGWNRYSSRGEEEVQAASGKGKPLPDATGTLLVHNDLVMTTIDKYADLRLCQVLSFTPQKVRVRDLRHGYKTVLKDTADIVKVDSSLYF